MFQSGLRWGPSGEAVKGDQWVMGEGYQGETLNLSLKAEPETRHKRLI